MKRTLHSLVLTSCALLGTFAQAGIVTNPASIVDHGSYIADTANQLDWYKFSNPVTTVGLSFSAANFLPGAGWTQSTLMQVRSLQTQFGWENDTGDYASGNAGITAAMAAYLGFTGIQSTHPVSSPFLVTTVYSISAMTVDEETGCSTTEIDCKRNTTYSAFSTFENKNTNAITTNGDRVEGDFALSSNYIGNAFIGTWFSRASVDIDPPIECGGLSTNNQCPGNVPVPSSIALLALGLVSLSSAKANGKKVKQLALS